MTDASKVPLTKVSVNFVPRAVDALNAAAERNRDTRTDTLNRAIQVYDVVTREIADGGQLMIKRPDGTIYAVRLI